MVATFLSSVLYRRESRKLHYILISLGYGVLNVQHNKASVTVFKTPVFVVCCPGENGSEKTSPTK